MNEFLNEIRTAIVIDNVDTDKQGKCKLRVLPEMIGMDEDKLPWCRPFLGKGNGNQNLGTHEIPEIDEYVKCLVRDNFWKQIEYISGDFVTGFYPYSVWENKASSMSELNSMSYPQPSFMKALPDGSIIFYNSETGEKGIYDSHGSYSIFDSSGNIIINSKDQKTTIKNSNGDLILQSNGNLEINGNSKQFVTWTELNTALTTFLTNLTIAMTTTPIIGNGAPQPTWINLPTSIDISSAKTTTVLTDG